MSTYYVGIDIGSVGAKTVAMNDEGIIFRNLRPTGWSSADTAADILQELSRRGITPENMHCTATGYGRISVPFAERCVTEITCHALGACTLFGREELVAVDIGGQDTKIIQVENRAVQDFLMNDKCSAGTGRFLEIMANLLAVSIPELCALAAHGGGTRISSMCTVFAESEVTGLIGRGETRENIAYAVVDSVIRKVAVQLEKLNAPKGPICLTGGLCECDYICSALAKAVGRDVITCGDARYAGAIGAAIIAKKERK